MFLSPSRTMEKNGVCKTSPIGGALLHAGLLIQKCEVPSLGKTTGPDRRKILKARKPLEPRRSIFKRGGCGSFSFRYSMTLPDRSPFPLRGRPAKRAAHLQHTCSALTRSPRGRDRDGRREGLLEGFRFTKNIKAPSREIAAGRDRPCPCRR